MTEYGSFTILVVGDVDGRVQSQMKTDSCVTAMARVDVGRGLKKALNEAETELEVMKELYDKKQLPFAVFRNLSGTVGTVVTVNFAFRV